MTKYKYTDKMKFGVGYDVKEALAEISNIEERETDIIIFHKDYMVVIDFVEKKYLIIGYGG